MTVSSSIPTRTTTDVLIVGAGPTGLTAANVLARYGVPFRLVDKGGGPTPMEESRALSVQARTLELFDLLGIGDKAVQRGLPVDGITLFIYGKRMGQMPLEGGNETSRPYMLNLVQGATERLLIDALAEADVKPAWNTSLTDLRVDDDCATATLQGADGHEEVVRARYVIGADGASSATRQMLSLPFEGDTYEKRFFLVDCEVDWTQDHGQLYLNMTKNYFLALFPMSGGHEHMFHIIGNTSPEMEANGVTVENVEQLLRKSGLDVHLSNPRWASGYKLHRRMVPRLRVGPVFLAGDAAHVHSPAGGQGMNTGIGDAFNLGWKLGAVCAGQAHPALLDSYDAERLPVARHILETTDRNFEFETTDNPIYKRLKLIVAPLAARAIRKTETGRAFLFDLISQIGIEYPDSPAVATATAEGEAMDKAKPGARAPYGVFEAGPHAGDGLFSLFSAEAHHLLLFEGAAVNGQSSGTGPADPLHEVLSAVTARYEVPVHIHMIAKDNRDLHARYGAEIPCYCLIRPDGHIAFRGRSTDVEAFADYLDGLFTPQTEVEASA